MTVRAKLLMLSSLAMTANLAIPGTGIAAARATPEAAHFDFAIPTQPLATALIAFGKQANVQVLTAGSTIARYRSPGVTGHLSPAEALTALLQGTELDYEFSNPGTVVVMPRARKAQGKTPVGNSRDEAKVLTPVVANALVERNVGFMATLASTALRNDVDLIDVPQSVSVVTRDLMDSQQVLTVADAVRNVAGVQYVDGSEGLPAFQVRGFYTGSGLIDGMPSGIAGSGDFPPLVGLQQVEVYKGPQSILGDTSGNNFGGLVNVSLKQPQNEQVHQLSYTFGELGETQLGVDLAGPLGKTPGLTYRLVASGEYADRSPQGYRHRRSAYFAPSIGWRGNSTQLVVGVQRILNRLPVPDHQVLLGNSLSTATPFSVLPGNPSDYASYQTNRIYYLLDQQLGHAWTWRSRGQYVQQRNDQQSWGLYDPMINGDVSAWAEAYRYNDAYYSLQNDFIRVFGTGPVTHTLTLDLDYSRSRIGHTDDLLHAYDQGTYNVLTSPPLPRVSAVVQAEDNQPLSGTPWSVDNGLLLQDQLALGDRWDMTLALRRSAYQVATNDIQGNPLELRRTKWVPNAGLVYKLTPDIAFYGGTASGFQPVSYLGENGQPLEPALSRQVEAGGKFNLFNEQARLTVSFYRIMLDHSYVLLSPQPPNFATLGPGQTNRGLELEFVGHAAPGLDISTSYTNALISNHDGTAASGAPRQRFNLWASYWFQGDALRGWGLAAGVLARSKSLGQSLDYSTYYHIPGQAEVGANVSYRTDRWRMTLGVKNLFGRRLYPADFTESFVPVRTRSSVLLSGTYDF
jgi:iron complex outermembrane receptor protein